MANRGRGLHAYLVETERANDSSGSTGGRGNVLYRLVVGGVCSAGDLLLCAGSHRRLERGSEEPNRRSEITIAPDPGGDVTMVPPMTTDCGDGGHLHPRRQDALQPDRVHCIRARRLVRGNARGATYEGVNGPISKGPKVPCARSPC